MKGDLFMKKHAKKVAVLLLALCLVAGAFSGCTDDNKNNNANSSPSASPSTSSSTGSSASPSSDGSSDTKIVDKPITLKVLTTSEAGITLSADTPVFQELSKRTNINFEIEELPLAEPAQKLNLIMASKQLPDLLANPGQGKTWFDKYGAEGALIPIQDLVKEHAPNLQNAFDNTPFGDTPIADLYSSDGNLYIVPVYSHPQPGAVWCIRQDWLDKVNMKAPTTVDEFIAVMKAFKDQNVNGSGDVLPFCASSGYIPAMVNFFGAHEGFYLDKDSDTIKYGPVEDNWKEAMNFIYRIYQEGLLDKEFPTNDTTIFEQKVSANRVGMFYGWPFSGLVRCNELIKAVDANAQYVPIAPIKKDASSVAVKEGKQATLIARSAITSSNKYPVETIKLINYLYSRDGEILMNWGIEGEDYTIVDGKPQFMDSIMKNSDGPSVARGKRGMQRAFPFLADKEAEMAVADELVVKAWTEYNESGALWPLMPNVSIPEDKQARFNSLNTQISTYLQEKRAAFMIGTESIDKEYDGFKKELENRGLSEILAIYNDAYTAYKANIK